MFSIEAEREFYRSLFKASQAIDGSYDEMLIAGGAPRDLLLGKTPKDFDIFIFNPSKTLQNKIKKHTIPAGGYELGSTTEGGKKTKYTVYNLDGKIQIILTNHNTVSELFDEFDYDFNQIGFTTDTVHASEKFEDFYMQDSDENFVTLTNNEWDKLDRKGIERAYSFQHKYRNYSFKDKNEVTLTPKLLDQLLSKEWGNGDKQYKAARVMYKTPEPRPLNAEEIVNMAMENIPAPRIPLRRPAAIQQGLVRDLNLNWNLAPAHPVQAENAAQGIADIIADQPDGVNFQAADVQRIIREEQDRMRRNAAIHANERARGLDADQLANLGRHIPNFF